MRKILVCLALLYAATAHAGITKWVDSKGVTHYSDSPAVQPDNAKELNIPNKPADAAPAGKSLADKELEFRKRRNQAQEDQQKAEKSAKEAEDRKQNCSAAKGNLAYLESGRRATRLNEKGESIPLDDQERASALADARKAIETWCKNQAASRP